MARDGEPVTVPDSELDHDEELVYTHHRQRFTVIGFEDAPGGGVSEISYRDGMQDGVARDWYPSGALKGEAQFRENVQHGWLRRVPSWSRWWRWLRRLRLGAIWLAREPHVRRRSVRSR